MLEREKREFIEMITTYAELKVSLSKAEQIQWKNQMTEEVVKELTFEKDKMLSDIIDIIKEL